MMLEWRPGLTLWEIEKEALRQAITHHRGVLLRVAKSLGISTATVYRKLDDHFSYIEKEALLKRRSR